MELFPIRIIFIMFNKAVQKMIDEHKLTQKMRMCVKNPSEDFYG